MTDHPPAPGQFVTVGGAPLHAVVDGTGVPVVVLESGLGGSVLEWGLVAASLAQRATVVRRDRPGLGWSPYVPRDRSAVAAAGDLHELLHGLELPPPYVLVGHSLGGFHIRAFSAAHPDEVAGLVFVDASHEAMFAEHAVLRRANTATRWFMSGAARVGRVGGTRALSRLYWSLARKALTAPVAPEVDEILQTGERLSRGQVGWMLAMCDEYAALDESCVQMRRLGTDAVAPTVPVRVISQARPVSRQRTRDMLADFQRHHGALATLGRGGPHVLAEHSGHLVPLDQPELVVEQVTAILDDPAR